MDISKRGGFSIPAPTGIADSRGPVSQQSFIVREYPTPTWVGGTEYPSRSEGMGTGLPVVRDDQRNTGKIGR